MDIFSPQWLTIYFVLGLLLGQFAIREWKWAALCGGVNALAAAYLQRHVGLSLAIPVVFMVLSFPLLLGISGLRSLPLRVGGATLAVPFISVALMVMGSLALFALSGLLGAVT